MATTLAESASVVSTTIVVEAPQALPPARSASPSPPSLCLDDVIPPPPLSPLPRGRGGAAVSPIRTAASTTEIGGGGGDVNKIQPPLAYRNDPLAAGGVASRVRLNSAASHAAAPPLMTAATQEYLDQLIWDKNELRDSPASFRHVIRLIDSEIQRVLTTLSASYTNGALVGVPMADDEEKAVRQEKIFMPVDKYPRYNFVGRILGPRGMTAKQLEEELGCKIMVRGRGQGRTEPLHVLIHCEDAPDKVDARLKKAVDRINDLLSPPPEGKDELKRKQLIELSIINGTYRPTTATKHALQAPRHAPPLSAALESSFLGVMGAPRSKFLPKMPLGGGMGMPPPPPSLADFHAHRHHSSMAAAAHHGYGHHHFGHSSSSPLSPQHGPNGSSLSSPPASPRFPAPLAFGGGGVPALDDQQAYLASLMAVHNPTALASAAAGSQTGHYLAEYYRCLAAMSLADPTLISSVYNTTTPPSDLFASLHLSTPSSPPPHSTSSMPPGAPFSQSSAASPMHTMAPNASTTTVTASSGSGTGSTSLIPQANVQQYMTAVAMLGNVPFTTPRAPPPNEARANGRTLPISSLHDGSGDAQTVNMQSRSSSSGSAPGGGASKRV